MIIDQDRFNKTIASFDAANAEDPNIQIVDGFKQPKELIYALRMSAMLDRFVDGASETLKLAARCQHIQRWKISRAIYPKTRVGYIQWRTRLRSFHAEIAETILRKNAYDERIIHDVCLLLKKENMQTNEEAQILEDVIVLVFLENDLEDFVQKHSEYDEVKFIEILRKIFNKMSIKGRNAALTLIDLPPNLLSTIQKVIVLD